VDATTSEKLVELFYKQVKERKVEIEEITEESEDM